MTTPVAASRRVCAVRGTLAWVLGRLRAVLPRREDLAAMALTPRQDLLAGITVGIVALPLALAFGITSGVGATAGLVTAVVAGTIAALFGGSPVQVSGPTGAMTVVLVPIVATYGARGVLVVGLLAGALLVAMAVAGVGRYVRFIPLPVIEGFTLGIAVIIGLQQVPAALGVPVRGEHVVVVAVQAVLAWVQAPQLAPVLLALAVAAAILLLRVRPAIPVALLAVVAATLVAVGAHLQVASVGALPTSLPTPHLPDLAWADLRALAAPALAVAALAALESLLSATVADAMSVADRHDPDRELFGQGLANLASPLFGGLPATAAIARTAVNIRSGARSRLSAVVHAGVLLLVVLVLGTVVALVPIAALAGVLIATSIRMVETHTIGRMLRSGRSDALVLVLTFVATVALDLATAVILGMVTAGALVLRHLAKTAQLHATSLDDAIREDGLALPGAFGRTDPGANVSPDSTAQEHALLDANIVAYRLDGPLFFGAAHAALLSLAQVDRVSVVILRLSRLSTLDATGAGMLTETIHDLGARGVTVLLSGVQAGQQKPLRATGILDELLAQGHVFADTPTAIAHARRHVARDHHHRADQHPGSPHR